MSTYIFFESEVINVNEDSGLFCLSKGEYQNIGGLYKSEHSL